ncbi:MAG: cellulase family glycosylhydrolase [Gemmatimonadota bacterium]|nr:MAG: cellulase family glycosylhydrolase [Gemmatimonadota bacterium]
MPTIDRRSFLGSLGAAAVAGSLPRPLKAFLVPGEAQQLPTAPRVGLFREADFPTIDAKPIHERTLRAALDGLEMAELRVADLGTLPPDAFDVFLNPYGSAFPKDAWGAIVDFLAAGGNWVNVGGVPFSVPVRREGRDWRAEVRQTAYHKVLGITQAFPVDVDGLRDYVADPRVAMARELAEGVKADTVYELYYRLTREKEFTDEDGSDGPREGVLTPLVSVVGAGEHSVAAPVVRVDRMQGPYAGGRWVLANFDGSISAAALRALVDDATLGSRQLTVAPSLACYRDGERPAVTVTLKTPGRERRGTGLACRVEVFDDRNETIAMADLPLEGSGFIAAAAATLEPALGRLEPGLYRVEAAVASEDPSFDGLEATSGFWIYDRGLLAAGRPFTTDTHNLLRDGAPYIVTGTSYMATDVHRRFLLEPNPHLWDCDFAAMRRAGVNMIRTGIWTGWRRYMPGPGSVNEAALRALDAFLLSARRHEMPVIFTFFAFVPHAWGGENPYLDPQAVEAQKEFVSRIVERYKEMNDVIWDLINEPNCCSPARLWQTRPNYDEHETRAWEAWLRERFSIDTDEELQSTLAELWRTLPNEAVALPRLQEFGDRDIFEGLRPLKAMEYRLFANDVFTRWAREMAAMIREAGGPQQLVTVGQDEGGTYERPAPMFHGPVVDFTSNHTWWLNDDLLWDSVVTKTPDRPNLISETGIRLYERIDGSAWRTEQDARDLLERKLVLATVTDTAGFVEWIWNTNPYMPLDNEVAIGLLRADGSAKPELHVLEGISRFVADSMRDLVPREPEPIVMVIPHSHMFSVRNYATAATQRCVRVMHHHLRVTMGAVGEYALDRLGYRPKLIVLPSPRILSEAAWQRLLELVRDGATLLVTGPIDSDEHWLPVERLERFGVEATVRPVAQEEHLGIGDMLYRLSYRGDKFQRLEKSVQVTGAPARVAEFSEGRGRVIWSPLPVELAEQVAPTAVLYRDAIATANVAPLFRIERPDPGVLVYPAVFGEAVLYGIVSELGSATEVRLTDAGTETSLEVALPPGRAALLLVNRRDGRTLGRYAPDARSSG